MPPDAMSAVAQAGFLAAVVTPMLELLAGATPNASRELLAGAAVNAALWEELGASDCPQHAVICDEPGRAAEAPSLPRFGGSDFEEPFSKCVRPKILLPPPSPPPPGAPSSPFRCALLLLSRLATRGTRPSLPEPPSPRRSRPAIASSHFSRARRRPCPSPAALGRIARTYATPSYMHVHAHLAHSSNISQRSTCSPLYDRCKAEQHWLRAACA